MAYHPNVLNAAIPYPKDWWKEFVNVSSWEVNRPLDDWKFTVPLVITTKSLENRLGIYENATLAIILNTIDGVDNYSLVIITHQANASDYSIGEIYTSYFDCLKHLWGHVLSSAERRAFIAAGFNIDEFIYPDWITPNDITFP